MKVLVTAAPPAPVRTLGLTRDPSRWMYAAGHLTAAPVGKIPEGAHP